MYFLRTTVLTLAARSDLSQNWLSAYDRAFETNFKSSWLNPSQKHDCCLHVIWLKAAVLNFHSFDCQSFGSYVFSQLTVSGDGLSVGIAHVHMAEHDDFSILPSCLRSSRGCAMLTPHLVKLFCSRSAFLDVVCWPRCHDGPSDLFSRQWCKSIQITDP